MMHHQVIYTHCEKWTVANLVNRLSYLQCCERLWLPRKAVLVPGVKEFRLMKEV